MEHNQKRYFAYVRVSTVRQGQGVSLTEQRLAIEQHATANGLNIIKWFEEMETAAKRGRAVFQIMLKEVERGRADGVIIHKIDRVRETSGTGADLGELIDRGNIAFLLGAKFRRSRCPKMLSLTRRSGTSLTAALCLRANSALEG